MKISAQPSVLGTVVLVVMIITGGALVVTNHPIPIEAINLFVFLLGATLGFKVPDNPLGSKTE